MRYNHAEVSLSRLEATWTYPLGDRRPVAEWSTIHSRGSLEIRCSRANINTSTHNLDPASSRAGEAILEVKPPQAGAIVMSALEASALLNVVVTVSRPIVPCVSRWAEKGHSVPRGASKRKTWMLAAPPLAFVVALSLLLKFGCSTNVRLRAVRNCQLHVIPVSCDSDQALWKRCTRKRQTQKVCCALPGRCRCLLPRETAHSTPR